MALWPWPLWLRRGYWAIAQMCSWKHPTAHGSASSIIVAADVAEPGASTSTQWPQVHRVHRVHRVIVVHITQWTQWTQWMFMVESPTNPWDDPDHGMMGMELRCRSIAGFILSELQANERQRRNVRNEIGQVAPHRHLGRKSMALQALLLLENTGAIPTLCSSQVLHLYSISVSQSYPPTWSRTTNFTTTECAKIQTKRPFQVASDTWTKVSRISTCAYVVVWVGGLEVWELMILWTWNQSNIIKPCK
jgi:hypothetical protein